MVRFYTLPPRNIPYPYILINANNPKPGIKYIEENKDIVEAVIIDSGVERLRKCNVMDYPGGYKENNNQLAKLYEIVASIIPEREIYVVASDYPDDYCPGRWGKNIEMTIESILDAIDRYKNIPWLLPVQGKWMKPESVVYSLELMKSNGLINYAYRTTRYMALANLCVNKDCKTIYRTTLNAYNWLVNHSFLDMKLHLFGIASNCVGKIKQYIYSWDSTAWTKPRTPGGSSAWNNLERSYLFLTFIHKYSEFIDLPGQPFSMRLRIQKKKMPETL